jgi:hypothetical protein
VLFLTFATVLLATCAGLLVRALRTERRYRRVIRTGIRVTGDIVDTTTRPQYNGGVTVTPVVRYWIAGRQHRALVANRTGAALGTSLDLAVDEHAPTTPWAVYENNVSPTILALGLLTALSAAMLGSAL